MAIEPRIVTLHDFTETCDNIVETQRKCYLRARKTASWRNANGHRTTTLDMLEGLKTLLIHCGQHDSDQYHHIDKVWATVLDWP